jgi:hypothetical protein
MYYGDLEARRKYFSLIMKKKVIKQIISDALGAGGAMNFRQDLPLMKIIDAKNDKDNDRFKKYVGAINSIVTDIRALFPCVDMTGIDLSWTAAEIHDHVLRMLDAQPVITLDEVTRVEKKGRKKDEA